MTKELQDTIIQLFTDEIQKLTEYILAYQTAIIMEVPPAEEYIYPFSKKKQMLENQLSDFQRETLFSTAKEVMDNLHHGPTYFVTKEPHEAQQSKPQRGAETDDTITADALREGVKRYGVPQRIYIDQGTPLSKLPHQSKPADAIKCPDELLEEIRKSAREAFREAIDDSLKGGEQLRY